MVLAAPWSRSDDEAEDVSPNGLRRRERPPAGAATNTLVLLLPPRGDADGDGGSLAKDEGRTGDCTGIASFPSLFSLLSLAVIVTPLSPLSLAHSGKQEIVAKSPARPSIADALMVEK